MVTTLHTTLTDEKLYALCREYGERARHWRQKFIGLLPEVYRRRLFERHGFSSIFEFAKKLAGLSEEQVRRVLHLEEKYRAMPVLHTMLINGEASMNKLSRVVSVATPETEEFWAAQVEHLSKAALEVLVKDEKYDTIHVPGHVQDNTNQPALQIDEKPVFGSPHHSGAGRWGLPDVSDDDSALQFSDEVKERLKNLQKKGIDINTLLTQFLDQRDADIASEKEQLVRQCEPRHGRGTADAVVRTMRGQSFTPLNTSRPRRPASRYIPVKIRNLITREHGTVCSIPTCNKPTRVIHHTQRFAISRNHDPRFLAPVCAEHHQIAHSIDLKYQEKHRY